MREGSDFGGGTVSVGAASGMTSRCIDWTGSGAGSSMGVSKIKRSGVGSPASLVQADRPSSATKARRARRYAGRVGSSRWRLGLAV
jgi:hypothetical protein